MPRQQANRQNSQEAAAVAAAAATVPGRYPMPTGVDKLTGLENWAVWKYLITLHLSGNRLIQCINERTSDEEMADPDGEAPVKDKAVQQAIAYNLHTNLIQLVAQTTTAYDAWATLCGTFENQGVQRRLTLINKLFDLRRSDYSSLEKYVLDVKEVVAQVQSAGIALDDEIAAANVLRNLRPEDSIRRRFVESSCTKTPRGNLNCSKTNHSEDYCYYKNMTKKRRTERDEQAQHSKEPRREPRRDSVVRFDSNSGGRSHQHSQGQGPKGGWVLKVAKRLGDACSSASSKEQGILNQFTVSDNPERDGVAERANRTLMEKVRAILKTCGLDIKFWPLALSTAIYLKNISPTKAVQGMVPMEAWTGSKPHIGHLRVFGCLAYAHIDKSKTKKLMDRTKACIFVGYDDERKGFKLLDPNSNAVFTLRSVIFNENSFPALRNTQGNERSVDSINYVPGAIIPVAVYPGGATSNPGCSNRAIPEGGDPSDSSTGQNDLRAKTGGVASGGAISNPGCSIRQIPDGENLSTGPAQSETPSLWGSYSDTSISRVSGDQVSMSELDSSISRSESGVSTEIDVETINTENAPQLSPSKRLSVPPKHLDDFVLYDKRGDVNSGSKFASLAIPTSHSVPVTVQEAVDSPEASFWLKAMEDELNSFESNRVWSLEAPANGAQVVGNKWVFKKKVDIDGSTLYRARLVTKGYTQTYGVDYFETFAPVVRRETLRILFSVAVNFNLKIAHLDVKTAFLHGDLKENVFLSQPDGFMIPGSEHLVCRLHKAVYGLKQAARSWNLKADQILKGEGFRNLPDEPCIYLKNPVNSVIIVALYVDDFYIFYRQESDKSKLLKALQTCVTIKDLGEARSCLGMEIVRNSDGSILLKQEEYIESILARFSMKDCKGAHTPMEFKLKLGHLPTGEGTDWLFLIPEC
ncbi:hypothetical protein ONE63_005102 [Megalurothrips usitatus]|uniref:Integrase catalytic domain-containing protein n=1 Tax=Megalurothrips usitatus TaxID=439358 RepID=A0AAV7XYA8_9NEOP|nr:hypothetical protein ONE63_005102 [Megalurothrips usitatus]